MEYTLPGVFPSSWVAQIKSHGRAPSPAAYHIYLGRNLVSVTTTWRVSIRNSSWFSYNKEVATWRGGLQKGSCETGVSCGEDWKEKVSTLCLGACPGHISSSWGTEDSG